MAKATPVQYDVTTVNRNSGELKTIIVDANEVRSNSELIFLLRGASQVFACSTSTFISALRRENVAVVDKRNKGTR